MTRTARPDRRIRPRYGPERSQPKKDLSSGKGENHERGFIRGALI
jgi:hypothetical protein